jgi:hypothetical protein
VTEPLPIAPLELLDGIGDYRPYLYGRSVDAAIVDPMWPAGQYLVNFFNGPTRRTFAAP